MFMRVHLYAAHCISFHSKYAKMENMTEAAQSINKSISFVSMFSC